MNFLAVHHKCQETFGHKLHTFNFDNLLNSEAIQTSHFENPQHYEAMQFIVVHHDNCQL